MIKKQGKCRHSSLMTQDVGNFNYFTLLSCQESQEFLLVLLQSLPVIERGGNKTKYTQILQILLKLVLQTNVCLYKSEFYRMLLLFLCIFLVGGDGTGLPWNYPTRTPRKILGSRSELKLTVQRFFIVHNSRVVTSVSFGGGNFVRKEEEDQTPKFVIYLYNEKERQSIIHSQ